MTGNIVGNWRIGLVAAVLLLLVGCGGGEDGLTRVQQGNLDGVLHFGNGIEPEGLDPHIVTGNAENKIVSALFEGLVGKNPETLEVEPGVAETWEISEDGTLYTFHIRDDARWSNGDPVTAVDFHWSWNRILEPELGAQYNYNLFPIANAEEYANGTIDDFSQVGVTVVDDHTLQVQLKTPTPFFLQLLDHYSTFPVHRPTIEAHGAMTDRLSPWARAGNLVGNGPFNLTEWQINSHVRVEKNDTYWDADAIDLNAIVFYPTENLVTEDRMFRDGQLHRTAEIVLDRIPVYRAERPEIVHIEPWLGTYFYMFNTTEPPFDDVRVRKALAMAIDRDLLDESVMQGIVEPAYALVPPGTLGYQPPKTFEQSADRARELLAEAGYPNGEGFPEFEILYNTQESHRRMAVAIQQMWASELNIMVTLVNQEWKVYLENQDNFNYDISRRGWIGDYVDPNTFLDMYITDGGNNKTGFSDPRYDEIILREAPATLDRDARYELYREAETILMEAMPILPVYTYTTKHLIDPSVKGMPTNIMDHVNYKYIWLDPDA
ncbi:MAG: peptide ABC transporter substrate-binding protein [Gammaproteobacteria bacterium]